MKKWLSGILGAVGMGLTRAAGWALVGFLTEGIEKFLPGPDGALEEREVLDAGATGSLSHAD